ncbi:MAG: hypothetical protein SVP52_02030 [Chloroflexota bacterium]|nr:hypothetical protein [Chloroflexota bacterium]
MKSHQSENVVFGMLYNFHERRARVPGAGVVGLARKDAERGVWAVLQYLDTLPSKSNAGVEQILEKVTSTCKSVVDFSGLQKLWAVEEKIADERGLPEFKFDTQEEMIRVIKGS